MTIKKYEQTDADKTKTDADEKKENRWMALNSLFISWQLLSKVQNPKGSIELVYEPLNSVISDNDFKNAQEDVKSGKIDSKLLYESIKTKITPEVKTALKNANHMYTKVTGGAGTAGEAKFEDLPLGIYMVGGDEGSFSDFVSHC